MTSVVMPVEPTPEMIEAGVKVEGWGCTPELDREAAANTYRAMLAAHPKPPADLVRAVIQATDDGDHHPPISQWAAERAVEVVMGARLEVESEPVGYCNPEHLTRIRREAGARGEAASTIYGYPAGTYTTPLYARPAPTVEEVAAEVLSFFTDETGFLPSPDGTQAEGHYGGRWISIPVGKLISRIHALWTGGMG